MEEGEIGTMGKGTKITKQKTSINKQRKGKKDTPDYNPL